MRENNMIYPQKQNVHKVLIRGYFVYFFFFLLGVYFDLVFNFIIFDTFIAGPFGFVLLMFASFLIVWAQKTSRNLQKENITKETFCQGPYRYTRSPTYLGLFFLMLGFGMIANAFFIVTFSLFSFFIIKFVFLKREEKILEEKYGTPYLEYKEMVKF